MYGIRLFFLMAVLALLSVFMLACGNDSGSAKYGDILHDKAAMAKFVDHLKGLGKGKELMIFQDIPLTTGSANINAQDTDDPTKVVQWVWHEERGWKSVPVTLKGDGYLEDNLNPISAFDFEAVVDFVLAAEKLVANKGYKDFRMESVVIEWSWNDGSLSLASQAPVGEPGGKQANFKGTIDGKVTKAEISWFNNETKRAETEDLL